MSFSSLLLVLLMLAVVASQPETTILHANQSVDHAIPLYYVKAFFDWYGPPSAVDYMNIINDQRAAMLSTVQLITTVNISALPIAPCVVVQDVLYYISNYTAIQDYICCHLAVLLQPAFPSYLSQLNRYYTETYAIEVQNMLDTVANIKRLRSMEINATNWKMCKNDTRIHIANTVEARSFAVRQMLGVVMHGYQLLEWNALTMATCVTYPVISTSCITSTVNSGLYPNLELVTVSLLYQPVCSQLALQAYENLINNITECSG